MGAVLIGTVGLADHDLAQELTDHRLGDLSRTDCLDRHAALGPVGATQGSNEDLR